MHKIVKSNAYGYGYGYGNIEPVTIDNEVHIQVNDEIAYADESEREKIKNDRKREKERVFREKVDEQVKKILDERAAELEAERSKIIADAKKEANALAADAKATTLSVLDKTTKECTLLKAQAQQEGYNDGYKTGHDEASAKCQKYIDGAAKLLAEINSRKDAYYISNEKEIRDTVFAMVDKIVRAELEINPLVTERIITNAAKNYRNSDYIKISISECGIMEKIKTDNKFINKLIPFIKDIEIEFLDDAPEGTIILDDDRTITDASITTQLDFLKEIMKNTRGEEQ